MTLNLSLAFLAGLKSGLTQIVKKSFLLLFQAALDVVLVLSRAAEMLLERWAEGWVVILMYHWLRLRLANLILLN